MRVLKLVLLFHLPYALLAQTLGFALEQIESKALIEKGLTGKGVKIGIIDGGFLGANEAPALGGHFEENRVVYYKDFVTPHLQPYDGNKALNDDHGTDVWQLIGGYHAEKDIQYGLATEATYYLARTDYDAYEKRQEEHNLIAAMSEMIAQGVRLFNVSLGYTNEYSNRSEDYTPDQIDGKSTWITQALDSLLTVHDVLVIVSAGNDGDLPWRVLSAPADSKHVLAIGATKLTQWEEMYYSSIGPDWLPYVKPELSVFSNIGTSYSAPVITGLAACMMQYDSTLKTSQIKDLLIRSSHLYPYPNNYVGYGVPSCPKLLRLMAGEQQPPARVYQAKDDHIALKIDFLSADIQANGKIVVYHKKEWRVMSKETIKGLNKLKIDRPAGCTQSTLFVGKMAMEILWEQD